MNIEKKIIALKKLYPLFEKQLKDSNIVLQNRFRFYKFVILYDQVFCYGFSKELKLVLTLREFTIVFNKKSQFFDLKLVYLKRNENNCQSLCSKLESFVFLKQYRISKQTGLCIDELQNIRNLLHGIKDNHVKDQINASNSDWREFKSANSKVMELKNSFDSMVDSDGQTSLDVFEKQVAEFFSQYNFFVEFLLKNWYNRKLMLSLFFNLSLSPKSQHFLLLGILYLDIQLERLLSTIVYLTTNLERIQQRRCLLEIRQNRDLKNY